MMENDGNNVSGREPEKVFQKCPECGEKVREEFRFCPVCGSAIPEITLSVVSSGRAEASEPRRRVRTNASKTEESFREFNAVVRSRRRKDERRGGLTLVLVFLFFVVALGGGVYWFLRKTENIPWNSVVVQKPEAKPQSSQNGSTAPVARDTDGNPISAPVGSSVQKADAERPASSAVPVKGTESAVQTAGIPEITKPTRGIVIGSSVNLRGSHTIRSSVVGRVTAGNRLEVLESWTSDEGAEAVTLLDVELVSSGGKKVKLPRGKGVTVSGLPDAAGMVQVTLPEDKNKVVYQALVKSLSDPQAWPWYRVKPEGGKEGWIFGKFLTVLNPRDEALPSGFLDTALTSFGATKDQLEKVLGKPSKSSVRRMKTAEGNGEETTLIFDGVTAVVYDGPGGPDVRKLLLTSNKFLLDGGLSVGMDRRDVLSLLGLPNDVDKGNEIYRLDKTTGIQIKYENYKVKSLALGAIN